MSLSSPARIQSLDVMRGVAILGILLANISAFAHPSLPELLMQGRGFSFFEPWLQTFVSGKFRGVLSILIGMGLWIQFRRLAERPTNPTKPLLRRYGLLLALGACHGLLIWWGDILFAYGIAAMLAIAFVRSSDETLWKVILWVGLGGLALTILGIFTYLSVVPGAFGVPESVVPESSLDRYAKQAATFEVWAHTQGGYLPQLGFVPAYGSLWHLHLCSSVRYSPTTW